MLGIIAIEKCPLFGSAFCMKEVHSFVGGGFPYFFLLPSSRCPPFANLYQNLLLPQKFS
jgi:hypothetical protein